MPKKQPIEPPKVRPGMRLNLGNRSVYNPGTQQYIEWRKPFFVVRVEIEKGIAGGFTSEAGFMVTAYNREGYRIYWYETSSNPHVIKWP